jgi:hypothetical protein
VWRREPYYSQLKQWSRRAVEAREQIVVFIKRRVIVILPNKDVDFGDLQLGEQIWVGAQDTPAGRTWNAATIPATCRQTKSTRVADVTGGEVGIRPKVSLPARAGNPVARSYASLPQYTEYWVARTIPGSSPGKASTPRNGIAEQRKPPASLPGVSVGRRYEPEDQYRKLRWIRNTAPTESVFEMA